MLGSMLNIYFQRKTDFGVYATHRKKTDYRKSLFFLDVEKDPYQLEKTIDKIGNLDYIINGIGIIKPYCKDDDVPGRYKAIKVNSMFPFILKSIAEKNNIKVIQIATDCVYSGKDGKYVESSPHDPLDVYGKTKSLGEVYTGEFLNLRCSIIGPETKEKSSLFEWVLGNSNGSTVNGFTHHLWNGLTTLQFSQICHKIICEDINFDKLINESNLFHCILNETVNKYQLVSLISSIFNIELNVVPVDNIGEPIDRSLSSERKKWKYLKPTVSMKEALMELHDFIEKENYYDFHSKN